jgi:PQQ-dependent dehydrogenase (methanol/ethanol family)
MQKKALFGTLALLALAGVVFALNLYPRDSRLPTVRPVTDSMLGDAAGSGDWLTYGRDYANQRFAPFTQINRQTIQRLEPLWRQGPRRLLKSYLRTESTPVVVDGMLIYTDPGMRVARPGNHVIAVDLRTGRALWSWYHGPSNTALCCGLVNRGVALHGNKVYVGTLDARLVALDRRTGKVVWDQQVAGADPAQGYSFTMAPLAAGGKIIIGTSGGEFGIRGFLDAYDPETGRRLWRFYTIPSPEEGGWWGRLSLTTPAGDRLPRDTALERRDSARYADTWKRGGGPVWTTPAYDPELGLVIFGIGNPSGVDGRTPPGDNLYTVSLAALDVATGKLRWYYQMVPHDEWDYDPASPPVLLEVPHDGTSVPAVAQAGKTGWVYILDRRSGKLLRRSQPFVPIENIFSAATAAGVRIAPGTRGGSNWPSTAYSPETGALYVLGSHIPMLRKVDSAATANARAKRPDLPPHHVLSTFTEVKNSGRFGTFTAVDATTGRLRWQHKVKTPLMQGGALATAGGLVFFPEPPYLNALDAETGKPVWRHELDKGSKGALGPPITFMVDGRQRVAITSVSGVTVFGLRGD